MDDAAPTAPTGPAGKFVDLSARQLTVLQLLARGYPLEQVALLLDCRPEDVALDLTAVQLRLGAVDQRAAVQCAMERDLVVGRRPEPSESPQ